MDPGDLYGIPLEQFVPERTGLARELRAQGDREAAAKVGKLAKPSTAAWAVNQLVRTQGPAVAELFTAGDALRRAQGEVVAGQGSARALRDAHERERAAVATLTETARGLLSAQGQELSTTVLERVSDTLHAAALEEGARSAVRDGCLTRELSHVGLGDAIGAPPVDGSDEPQASAAAAREAGARAREKDTRRAAERAARELDGAQRRRDRAAALLQESEDALAAARERAAEAEHAHRRARKDLERIGRHQGAGSSSRSPGH